MISTTWLRKYLVDGARVQPDASREAMRRVRVFGLIALGINVGYLTYFWGLLPPAPTPLLQRYNFLIGLAHLVLGSGMTALTAGAFLVFPRVDRLPWTARSLQFLFCAWVIAFGTALTLADQWVGSNTTNYVMTCLIIAMLGLLRPAVGAGLYALAFVVIHQLLPLTQGDPAKLEMARSHTLSGTILSFVAVIVIWSQFVTETLLRRELSEANEALEKKREELSFLAAHDTLTGLRNRRAFLEAAGQELARAGRYPCDTGLLIADLDHFKRINDTYGHPAGDAVLKAFSRILSAQLRQVDVSGRLGGEEFIVLLPNTGLPGAELAAEKLRAALEATEVDSGPHRMKATVSIGLSTLPAGTTGSLESLYQCADQALYQAKEGGRNRVVHRACEG